MRPARPAALGVAEAPERSAARVEERKRVAAIVNNLKKQRIKNKTIEKMTITVKQLDRRQKKEREREEKKEKRKNKNRFSESEEEPETRSM